MTNQLTIKEARERLADLPEILADAASGGAATITRRGKPVLAVMSWELYDAIQETLAVMSDPELMAQLRQSVKEIEEGKTHSWQSVKDELGLTKKPSKPRRQRQLTSSN